MEDMKRVPLSPFDNVMARFYGKFILFLRLRDPQGAYAVHGILEQGLHMTLCDLPYLAGKVLLIQPNDENPSIGRLEIQYPATLGRENMPKLNFRDYTDDVDYDDLIEKGIPQDELDEDKFFPAASPPDLAAGADVVSLQANYVNGGVLLGVGMHHSATDGTGSTTFVKLWASNCARIQGSEAKSGHALDLPPEGYNHSSLWDCAGRVGKMPLDTSEDMWRLLGLNPVDQVREPWSLTAPSAATSVERCVKTSIFYVSPKAFAQLKKDGSDASDAFGLVSANDILMGLLWQAIMRARTAAAPCRGSLESDAESSLDTTLDARFLFCGLSAAYIGCVVLINTTRLPVRVLTDPSTSLRKLAAEFRVSVTRVTKRHAHEALALANTVPDYTKLSYPFASFDGDEVCITSLLQLTYFEMDWGRAFDNGGRIESMRPPRRELDSICRRCMVMPMRPNGGFEIFVSLLEEEMKYLERDEVFSTYAMFVCR